MNDILFIDNDYCTDITDFKAFLELGVQNHAVRYEILAYYRDGVLADWLEANGFDGWLDTIKDDTSKTDNEIYDDLYRQITGNKSVINSLKSNFSDCLAIVSKTFSSNGSCYDSKPDFEQGICCVKLSLKILKPENTRFTISVNIFDCQEINPSEYKKGQIVEMIFALKDMEKKSIRIAEGDDNVLYEVETENANVFCNIVGLNRCVESVFNDFDVYHSDLDSIFTDCYKYKRDIEKEILTNEKQALEILRQYERAGRTSNYVDVLNENINSNLQCFVCLKAILYVWTYYDLNTADRMAWPLFSRSKNYEFTRQMYQRLPGEYTSLRVLTAKDNSMQGLYKGNQPQWTTLRNFLKWYFLHMLDFDNALERV